MKISCPTLLTLLLCLVLAVPAAARDKRGNRSNNGTAGNAVIVEPDRMAEKAHNVKLLDPLEDPSGEGSSSARGHINGKYLEGIDVSHYQYTIDWQRLAANHKISYVYIKATEGSDFIDDYYAQNIRGAHRAGISVGAYHFYRPNVNWRSQLANMRKYIKKEEQDLVPMIDIEVAGGNEERFIGDLMDFLNAVTKAYGKRPLLYTYQNFYNKHFVGSFKQYHWMIANYSQRPELADGRSYIMWQYSDSGRFSGITRPTDKSRLMPGFSLSELRL